MRRPRFLLRSIVLLALALAALVAVAVPLRARARTREVLRTLPGLDAGLARHLATDSDSAWARTSRRLGASVLMDLLTRCDDAFRLATRGDFAAQRRRLDPLALRVAQGLRYACDCDFYERSQRFRRTQSDRDLFELYASNVRYLGVIAAPDLDATARLAVVDSIIAGARRRRDLAQIMDLHHTAALLELQRGNSVAHRARLQAALDLAREIGEQYFTCQVLGEMGVILRANGHPDSMLSCFEEGIAIARRHRFGDQSARLLLFEARYDAEVGRLALAADRMVEAQRLCEADGGGMGRLRSLIAYANFLVDLGCWDLAERALRRVPPLMREFPGATHARDLEKHTFDADLLRSRIAFATGRPDEGRRWVRPWLANIPAWNHRAGYADLFDAFSWGLIAAGDYGEALRVCERGLAHCDSMNVPATAARMALRRAQALERLGRDGDAAAALDDLDRRLRPLRGLPELVPERGRIVRARLLLRRGDVVRGRAMLAASFADLRTRIRERGTGEMNFGEMHAADELRDGVHELARLRPAEGYAFELAWRSLSAGPWLEHADGRSGRPPWAPIAAPPALHLVFHVDGGRLLRWIATPRGVTLDTLALGANACDARVRGALAEIESDAPAGGEVLGPRARAALRALARALLPDSLARRLPPSALLCVSPDGPLAALPFEALPAPGPRGEQPLAQWANVAYLRGRGPAGGPPAGKSIVVSDPDLNADLRRRYAWAGSLAGSEAESRIARARWTDVELLTGAGATKAAVTRALPGAERLYVATHHVRDAAAPFLGFIPLAAPEGSTPDASLLEQADIRALDLTGCRLAVLASCASGVPYRVSLQPGPSLADAFLDAGARVVVRSLWDVDDEETRAFMEHFLARQGGEAGDVVALNEARREAMATPGGSRPRVWAAWSAAITWPARPGGAGFVALGGPRPH